MRNPAPFRVLVVTADDGKDYAGVTWSKVRGFFDPITNRSFAEIGLTVISWRYDKEEG